MADDHPLILKAIHQLLALESDLAVVGEAADGEAVQRLAYKLQPDVLLLDLVIPGLSPQAILAYLQIHSPHTRVVILSGHNDERDVQDLIAAGVAGYVLKTEAAEAVVDAIRTIVQGGTWFSQSVMQKLVKDFTNQSDPVSEAGLTGRELEILEQMALGLSNQEIAEGITISERTVKYHVKNIYSKLGTDSRAKAIAWAWRHGVVKSDT
ncbi:MAG: DNA-binding response regulator [Chloroflexi bacterium]|nr:MAG: DNA-binding response regulator [Chloroflexota bacterium]